ncbi:hypothetical protein EW093_08465 [Thiospirochaeta perfilievii]|uniref:DUF3784 domain-containing protein n=1 Tax=Thiospirochaeta perfilievii TaxID=252967 RepID=A0A5C1QCR5_9SPIO|nr:hypothetical protein [Thiospirochaeta perfilievii]QEN04739.1 hypothetical protein EW093_08465 [Thiospirochaeta perfilievii]
MDILSIVIIVFLVLELLNVIMLYKTPGTKRGNGLGVFKAFEKSKEDKEVFELVTYLINWVAGTKLIFIVLLIGILITGSDETKVFSVIALIFSILTFFTRLYPSIKKMDGEGQITPAGYSKTLGMMIISFIVVFFIAVIIFLYNCLK